MNESKQEYLEQVREYIDDTFERDYKKYFIDDVVAEINADFTKEYKEKFGKDIFNDIDSSIEEEVDKFRQTDQEDKGKWSWWDEDEDDWVVESK